MDTGIAIVFVVSVFDAVVSNNAAGTFGAVLIVSGLVGAAVAGQVITPAVCNADNLVSLGALLETTKAYRSILKGGFLLCQFAMLFFFCMLYSNNFYGLLCAFCLLGAKHSLSFSFPDEISPSLQVYACSLCFPL
jgi:hypothetical protein